MIPLLSLQCVQQFSTHVRRVSLYARTFWAGRARNEEVADLEAPKHLHKLCRDEDGVCRPEEASGPSRLDCLPEGCNKVT